jgi:hypothetical protein
VSELLKITGKATAEGVADLLEKWENDEEVGEVAILVLATMTKGEKARTAHRGKDRVATLSMSTAILASGDEHRTLVNRLGEERARIENEKSGQRDLLKDHKFELEQKSVVELKAICKDRALGQAGSKADLVQRIIDAGG